MKKKCQSYVRLIVFVLCCWLYLLCHHRHSPLSLFSAQSHQQNRLPKTKLVNSLLGVRSNGTQRKPWARSVLDRLGLIALGLADLSIYWVKKIIWELINRFIYTRQLFTHSIFVRAENSFGSQFYCSRFSPISCSNEYRLRKHFSASR